MKTARVIIFSIAAIFLCAARISLAGLAYVFLFVSDAIMAVGDVLKLREGTAYLRARLEREIY